MTVKWIHTLNAGDSDEAGNPIQYWFVYTVGSLDTAVHMATNQYWWEGDREGDVSGVLLEPVMPIHMKEPFVFNTKEECEEWQKMCQYWMDKN